MIKRFFTKEKMIWLYLGLSTIGYLLIFYNYRIARYFITVGASSLLLSFGIFVGEDYGVTLSIIAATWFLLFFVLLIVSVIKIIKKQYRLFKFLITADAIITLMCVAYWFVIGIWYSFNTFILDAVISVIYVCVFYKCENINLKEKNR